MAWNRFILIHAILSTGKEFIMGYFSEMSLDMREGRKPSAASLTRECAFEDGENFDSCRCRRLTVSLYRLPQSRRRSLLLRTTEDLDEARKSWDSLTRLGLPLKRNR